MSGDPVLELDRATLERGGRTLWSGLDLAVGARELVTVIGPNGAGKSSLLQVLLGLLPLTRGAVRVAGRPARRGDHGVGYVPQSTGFDVDVPLRGEDLVRLGVDGHRWGLPGLRRSPVVADLLERVGATHLARVPVGRLSGGEQQRLRLAQALAGHPRLLLCDEPLSSLDVHRQAQAVALLDDVCRPASGPGAAVVVVTHDVNPLLAVTDVVVYLREGRCAVGRPEEVFRSDVLSRLYDSPVEVVRRGDRVAVLGAGAA